ncbi:MAG: DUF2288 domain-containing protein [Gammaproteobacteria bacterium]|nr:MAG: DUF2288 domain-containing protein [Gammaproteobacteria bacterium]
MEQRARGKLVAETAKIPWRELQRFFANGTAVFVSPTLDLVEAAYQLSVDNVKQVEKWREDGILCPMNDALAIEWLEKDTLVWSVVARPWVLVQAI